jgi:hypothetical protein
VAAWANINKDKWPEGRRLDGNQDEEESEQIRKQKASVMRIGGVPCSQTVGQQTTERSRIWRPEVCLSLSLSLSLSRFFLRLSLVRSPIVVQSVFTELKKINT